MLTHQQRAQHQRVACTGRNVRRRLGVDVCRRRAAQGCPGADEGTHGLQRPPSAVAQAVQWLLPRRVADPGARAASQQRGDQVGAAVAAGEVQGCVALGRGLRVEVGATVAAATTRQQQLAHDVLHVFLDADVQWSPAFAVLHPRARARPQQ